MANLSSSKPAKKKLSVDDLLRAHFANIRFPEVWNVPQADEFNRVAELPLLVAEGMDNSQTIAQHFGFHVRQSSYYRQATEFLGLVTTDRDHRYLLTDLGRQYASRQADERRRILAELLANFPPMRAVLEMSAKKSFFDKEDVAQIIERHSKIRGSTPARRAATLISWLKWLQTATGAVESDGCRFRAS